MSDDPIQKTYKGLAFAVAAALVLGFGYWMLAPGDGPGEFELSREAMRHTRSWKLKFSGTMAGKSEIEAEVSCPDAHVVRRQEDGPEDFAFLEYLVVDGISYRRKALGDAWDVSETAWGFEAACDQMQKGHDTRELLPPFASIRLGGRFRIERGESKTVEGEQCRVWRLKSLLQGEAFRNEEICIGETDHLPCERITNSGRFTYYAWNTDILISRPSNVRVPEQPQF